MLHKKTQVESIISDLGENCIYGFTETWLKNVTMKRFGNGKKITSKQSEPTANLPKKTRGGEAMMIVPKNLNLKLRRDLVHTNGLIFKVYG